MDTPVLGGSHNLWSAVDVYPAGPDAIAVLFDMCNLLILVDEVLETVFERRSILHGAFGLAGIAGVIFTIAALSSCTSTPMFEDGARIDVASNVLEVHAIAGRTLVVPVDIRVLRTKESPAFVTNIVPVQLGSDTILTGKVYRIGVSLGVENILTDWLPPQPWWDVRAGGTIPIEEVNTHSPAGAEFWVIAVDLPTNAHGQTMRIAGRAVNIRWHEPWKAPQRSLVRPASSQDQSRIVRLLRPAAASPTSLWRVWLLHDRKPTGVPMLAGLLGTSLGHPVLDAMDQQVADRWRLALRALDEDDPLMSHRVRNTLTRLVYFDGNPVPAWGDDPETTSVLLNALLRANQGTQRVALAVDWLRRQRGLVAWVVDDAMPTAQSETGSTIGIADLRGMNQSLLLLDSAGEEIASIPIPAYGAILVEIPRQADRRNTVRTERDTLELPDRFDSISVAPPGARLGPFVRPMSMPNWLGNRVEREPQDWATAGLMYREAAENTWLLYLECRVPLDFFAGPTSEDFVRVWFGSRGNSRAVLRVSSLGAVFDELTGEELLEGVVIRRERDRWTALFAVPESILAGRDRLIMGFERLNAGGGRSSWPRPVFPWQIEPGRAVFELGAWETR